MQSQPLRSYSRSAQPQSNYRQTRLVISSLMAWMRIGFGRELASFSTERAQNEFSIQVDTFFVGCPDNVGQ